jgi:electron transport complex protein RnfA
MSELILILVGTVLVNNFVLVRFLGLCPFMGVSRNLEAAFGMSMATAFVLVIAASVQFTEIMVRRQSPLLHQLLGIYIPLIATNCAVLGVALLNVQEADGFIQSIFYGFGAAGGFALVLVLFAAIRERLQAADVPRAFRGTAIALITAGIMSLAFMGFSGMARL